MVSLDPALPQEQSSVLYDLSKLVHVPYGLGGVVAESSVISVFRSRQHTQLNAFLNRLFQFDCPTNVERMRINLISGSCRARHADMVTKRLILKRQVSDGELNIHM